MKADIFSVAGCIALALFIFSGSAQAEPLATTQLTPDRFKWDPTPFGGQKVTLVGDEQKPGMYVYRVRFPANFKVQPHFHPDERVVTVMSGTLYMGYGEQFDESGHEGVAGRKHLDRAGQAAAFRLGQGRRRHRASGRRQRTFWSNSHRTEIAFGKAHLGRRRCSPSVRQIQA